MPKPAEDSIQNLSRRNRLRKHFKIMPVISGGFQQLGSNNLAREHKHRATWVSLSNHYGQAGKPGIS